MEYLVVVDMEGIHGVKGENYKTINESFDYAEGVENAINEINTVVKALFDNGATKVGVWDNHGAGTSIDFSKVDSRVIRMDHTKDEYRYDFVKEHNFKRAIFLGYHSMGGTVNGVLAHTYSSKLLQYIKLEGELVGEFTFDSFIMETHGIAPIFACAGDICLKEVKGMYPEIQTVCCKYEKGRNDAEFVDSETVLTEIYNGVAKAVNSPLPKAVKKFPEVANVEIRYARPCRAESHYKNGPNGIDFPREYGDDSHVLKFKITKPQQIMQLL